VLLAAYWEHAGTEATHGADELLAAIAEFAECDPDYPDGTASELEWLAAVLVDAARRL
jgi:hypothetical protein